jgi:type IV pilus assembly protein PilO
MTWDSLLLAAWQRDKKLPVVVVFLLLLNVGAFVGMKYYVSPQVETLEREYIERQADLRQGRTVGRTPDEPQDELWVARDDLQTFWQAIPSRTEFTVLIGELFTLSEEAGLEIDQISYKPEPVEGHELLRYGLSFSVGGDYSQVKRFVHSLEQSERLVAIEDLSLSGSDDQGRQEVRLNLRLSTLFRTGTL